jgi:predicted nucleotidyltransferase
MDTEMSFDREAIAAVCRPHGVTRLSVFGSALSDRFNPARSDVDLLVEFGTDTRDPFSDYFGLKEDLENLLMRPVDLVMASAIRNPFSAASAAGEAQEVYAA